MSRDLTPEEREWLQEHPLATSHAIGGQEFLAACEDCEWVAQADSFDYLMEQASVHLKDTFVILDGESQVKRRDAFILKFQWDPWEEGVINETTAVDMELMDVGEVDEQGVYTTVDSFFKDLGDYLKNNGEEK